MLRLLWILIAALAFATGPSARAAEPAASIPDVFLHMFRARAGKPRTAWFNANAAGRTINYAAKIVVVNKDENGTSVMLEYWFGDAVACKIPNEMMSQIKGWTSGDTVRCKGTLSRYSQSLGSIFLWVETSNIERTKAQ